MAKGTSGAGKSAGSRGIKFVRIIYLAHEFCVKKNFWVSLTEENLWLSSIFEFGESVQLEVELTKGTSCAGKGVGTREVKKIFIQLVSEFCAQNVQSSMKEEDLWLWLSLKFEFSQNLQFE